MAQDTQTKAMLVIKNGLAVYVGELEEVKLHKHHAIQISIGIDSKIEIGFGDDIKQVLCVVINFNVKHRLLALGKEQVLMLIEPESIYAECLKNCMSDEFQEISLSEKQQEALLVVVQKAEIEIEAIIDVVFSLLDIHKKGHKEPDKRVLNVIRYIEQSSNDSSLKVLASHVQLSESRLQHLFKEQVGISIKRYKLWKRLMEGIKCASETKNLTLAAHEAGFSDSAHMSRTFNEMFGLTLSSIFKNDRVVQVKVVKDSYN